MRALRLPGLFARAVARALLVVSFAASSALAADEAGDMIRRLEQSGALDQAVIRALVRIQQQSQAAEAAERERQQRERSALAANARPVDPARDWILGPEKARVSIIEYSDFECPYCKRFHPTPIQVLKSFEQEVNLVWRHFPLDFHDPVATLEAVAADCAGQVGGRGKFWEYTSAVMEKTASGGKGLPAEPSGDPLLALAVSLKLDAAEFSACRKTPGTRERVQQDLDDGVRAGINGTPGLVLRDNRTGRSVLIEGVVPAQALVNAIQELLKLAP
jgi:protein-disulfide isomerase